eukprot:m.118600 g.118600  ORF g.118600 m.118600 type:complete len:134 (-) comp10987_c0_seq1:165-566(-)
MSTTTTTTTTAHVVDNTTRIGIDIVEASSASIVSTRWTGSGGTSWDSVDIVRGQTTPTLQGWYSPNYGTYASSPTLVYGASVAEGNSTFAWLLVPTHNGAPSGATASIAGINDTHVTVEVEVDGVSETVEVAV